MPKPHSAMQRAAAAPSRKAGEAATGVEHDDAASPLQRPVHVATHGAPCCCSTRLPCMRACMRCGCGLGVTLPTLKAPPPRRSDASAATLRRCSLQWPPRRGVCACRRGQGAGGGFHDDILLAGDDGQQQHGHHPAHALQSRRSRGGMQRRRRQGRQSAGWKRIR